jgi:predicted chitinase
MSKFGPTRDWVMEKQRIGKLLWWDKLKGKHGFPDSIRVYHFHPLGLIGNFQALGGCSCKELTPELLKVIAPGASTEKIELYFPHIIEMFKKFGIKDCLYKAHVLAQFMTESNQMKATVEDGSASYLQSKPYYPYIGRELIQLTGSDNYKGYGKYVTGNENAFLSAEGFQQLEIVPHCVYSAGWYLAINRGANKHGNEDDLLWMTITVNGGYNGYEHRLKSLNRIIDTLKVHGHLQKNHNGKYLFEESRVYNETRGSFAWGLYCDPNSSAQGTIKNVQEALAGYKRYLELTPDGHFEKRIWYGVNNLPGHPEVQIKVSLGNGKFKYNYRLYAQKRVQALGG